MKLELQKESKTKKMLKPSNWTWKKSMSGPRNNMEFNSLKFELLRYGDDDEIKTTTQYFNSIRTITEEKHVVRDLGIIMSRDATFTAHIEIIVSKAQSTISSISRCFKTRTPEVMIQLWKSLVIPHFHIYTTVVNCGIPRGKVRSTSWRSFRRILPAASLEQINLITGSDYKNSGYIPRKEDRKDT